MAEVKGRQFVHVLALEVDPLWRRRSPDERRVDADALRAAAEVAAEGVTTYTYSMIGTRADASLLFWRLGNSLEQRSPGVGQFGKEERIVEDRRIQLPDNGKKNDDQRFTEKGVVAQPLDRPQAAYGGLAVGGRTVFCISDHNGCFRHYAASCSVRVNSKS